MTYSAETRTNALNPTLHEDLSRELGDHGLRIRGTWHLKNQQNLDGAVMCLVGVVGSEFWPLFKASPFYRDGLSDPLDRWSRYIGDNLAQKHHGQALYPFDGPPWHPFQQWADRCEPTQPSRMMLRIHPQFGLWHAYRFALLLPPDEPPTSTSVPSESIPVEGICASCPTQACLHACPVNAYSGTSFDIQLCTDHLHRVEGSRCMRQGCQARMACPVGSEYRYETEHAAFHMQAFLQRH
jgi:hypothetical protein